MSSWTNNTLFAAIHVVVVPVAFAGALSACLSSSEGGVAEGKSKTIAAAAAPRQQLIIKFKPGTLTCDANGIARLASATSTTLEFVRPMSGDACVIQQLARQAEDFSQGESALKRHPAVELLELDAPVRAF